MAFRFHKRVKLAKGAWVNVSKTGLSLSFGVKGVTGNVSRRGLTTSLNIPGSGLSYRKRLLKFNGKKGSAGKQKPSKRTIQKAQAQQARAQNLVETQQVSQEFEHRYVLLLNFWREQIRVITPKEYSAAAARVSFETIRKPPKKYDPSKVAGVPPKKPTESMVRADLTRGIEKQLLERRPIPWVFLVVLLAVAFVLSMPSFLMFSWVLFSAPTFLFLFCMISAVGYVGMKRWWLIDYRNQITNATNKKFNGEFVARIKQHSIDLEEYRVEAKRRIGEAEKELQRSLAEYEKEKLGWDASENERTKWARGVLDGEPDCVESSVAASFAELVLPFESELECFVSADGLIACINLDLPEIEDAIVAHSVSADKQGMPRKVKRDTQKRYEEYQVLVNGFVLLAFCTTFSAAPTVERVVLGGYTQRGAKATDTYVVQSVCDRKDLPSPEDLSKINSQEFLSRIETKCRFNHNGRLLKVPKPDWNAYTNT